MENNKCQLYPLPKIVDGRGYLSFIEEFKQVPFKIKRSYWIYDVPGGVERGGHAYHENEEFIVALSGSFTVCVDDGKEKKEFLLNRSYYGLFVPKKCWRTINNFSTNALALIVASTEYREDDYILDYESFLKCVE